MTRTQLSQASEWLRTAVVNNPEGLLLLAAGGVLLMRRSGAVGGSVGFPRGTGERSGRTSESLLDQAASVSESIASSTSDYARAARRAASDGSARILRQAQNTFESGVDRALRDQPLLVALSGLAAGVAVAAVLPPSNLEQQALGPLSEQITEEASRVGDQLRKTASKAAGTLKTAVQENSLDPDGLKKTVSEVTEVVRDGIKGETHGQPQSSSGQSDWRQGR
jgi:hypothetical protein